jgi:hypothetical protein
MHFYWNEKIDYAIMDILKDYWDSPLKYGVSLFNTSCNRIIIKIQIKDFIQYLQFFFKTTKLFL